MTLLLHSHMQLGNQPNKLTHDTTLFQNEKCIVKAYTGTLTLPILIDKETGGQLFIGKGEFTLDAIIETPRGALGKSTTRNLNPDHPFIMLGDTQNLNQNLTTATTQDLTNMGYKNTEELLKTANEAFDNFTHKSHHNHTDIDHDAHIFAFATEHDKWDLLIAQNDKLVYTSKHQVYVSRNNDEGVSINPAQILVAKKGKTIVIDKGNILVEKDEP